MEKRLLTATRKVLTVLSIPIAALVLVDRASASAGTTLLFWGNTNVQYPSATAIIRTNQLLDSTWYHITGRTTIANLSSGAANLTCTASMNNGGDVERITVPAASRLPLQMHFVASIGTTPATSMAQFQCTCSGNCSSLFFENISILAESIPSNSGTIQVTTPAIN